MTILKALAIILAVFFGLVALLAFRDFSFSEVVKTKVSEPQDKLTDKTKSDGQKAEGVYIDNAPLDLQLGHLLKIGTYHSSDGQKSEISQESSFLFDAKKEVKIETLMIIMREYTKVVYGLPYTLNKRENLSWGSVGDYLYIKFSEEKYVLLIERSSGSLPHLIQTLIVTKGSEAALTLKERFPELSKLPIGEINRLHIIAERPWLTIAENQTRHKKEPVDGSVYYLWLSEEP
jgi:hypothetical protein